MSDSFLRDNYGAPDAAGRKRCQAQVEGRASRQLRSYRITEFSPKLAEVLAVDSKGSRIVMTFAFAAGEWLLDGARSP